MDWIANGESGLIVRKKLNSSMTPISSAKITTPVAFFDVALPSGYMSYFFKWSGILGAFVGAASIDNGSTFYCDPSSKDTYGIVEFGLFGNGTSNIVPVSVLPWDSLIDLQPIGGDLTIQDGFVWIEPGDSITTPRFFVSATSLTPDAAVAAVDSELIYLNPIATITPVFGRINLMRFLPYGVGDCNPPTSGKTLATGAWALFGIPAPT